MDPWSAWAGTRTLAFIHARVRQALIARGVQSTMVDVGAPAPLHVYEAGPTDAARTVVLLHGLGNSANDWSQTLPLLAWRGDRVLAIDLPGHGWSAPHDERGFLQVREHADLVRRVVDARQAGTDLALVGHSLGGWVATRAHLSGLPASKLVLVEAAGLEHEAVWESIEMLRIEHEQDVRRFLRTVMHKVPFGLNLLSHEVAAMFRGSAVLNFINNHDRADMLADRELDDVTAKTTIIWGENDGLIPPIIAHRWHAGIPGSTLRWIPECGHAPQFERPWMFQRLLEEALGHPTAAATLRRKIVARLPPIVRRRLAES